MKVEVLSTGDGGPALDPHVRALLEGDGPAQGELEPWTALREGAPGTGSTPADLAEALARAQDAYGTGPRASENARSLAGGALAVVTGQQPGLVGGPMLACHKAAGAIAIARTLSERLRRPVVPVFWTASEDHDLDEVNRAWLVDAAGDLRSLRLDVAADGRSVRDVDVRKATEAFLPALREALPATPRGDEAMALATPPAGADLGTWFSAVLARVFGDAGLVVVEPHVLAPWAGPTWARLVRGADLVADAIGSTVGRHRAKGLPIALEAAPDGLALFVRETEGGRRHRVVHGAGAMTREALAKHVESHPRLASGDVVGRVVLQHTLLPVVALVGGPAELAYLAVVREVHAALGVPFPACAARPSATWIEPRAAEAVAAFGARVAEVVAGTTEAPPPGVEPAAADERIETLRREVERLAQEAGASSRAAAPLRAAAKALADAEVARAKEADERAGRGRARWERARNLLRPRGMPQERVLGPVALAARHGVEAIRTGLAALDPLARGHQAVRLD